MAAAGIYVHVGRRVPFVRVFQRGGSGQLERAKRARVDIALDAENPLDKLRIRGYHSDAPTGHIVALAERVELDANVARALHLQDAEPFLPEDETVGVVIDNHYAVAATEIHQLLVRLAPGGGSGGHVGIVAPKEFDSRQVHPFEGLKVGLPAMLGQKVIIAHLATQQAREGGVRGVTRVGHQHALTWIDQSEGHMKDALLRTNEGLNLGERVEGYAVPARVKLGHCLAQLWDAASRLIAVGIGATGFATQGLDGSVRGWLVGTANGQTDDVHALRVELGHLLEFAREVVFRDGGKTLGGRNRIHD